jgi:hypothetical protein
MQTKLEAAVEVAAKGLATLPGTELNKILPALQQLRRDLQQQDLKVPNILDEIVTEAILAKVEVLAYKDAYQPDEIEDAFKESLLQELEDRDYPMLGRYYGYFDDYELPF